MPQINVAKLFMLMLPRPDKLIIIDQSECFGITPLNFAVIKPYLRFGAHAVCPHTPSQNHKLIHSKVNMHQQRFSTSMQKNGQSFLDVTARST